MNWQHLRAFLWLHGRLRTNRQRKAGVGNRIIETVLSVISVVAAGLTFLIGLAIGLLALAKVSPLVVMLTCDGFVAAFLLMSAGELMTELQRTEMLSVEKFLHLPVSLSGIFIINYLASFFGTTVALFFPAMIGLSIGLVASRGVIMLVMFPMVIALFLMVTALIYQFRGWLATLMQNKRRRRNIVTLVTVMFILLTQIPNILIWSSRPSTASTKAVQNEVGALNQQLATHQISPAEYQQRSAEVYRKYGVGRPQTSQSRREEIERTATTVNLWVPPGWLAYGTIAGLHGAIQPALFATLGFSLIAMFSLARSYRTTTRLYTGQFAGKPRKPVIEAPERSAVTAGRPDAGMMEGKLPWISEQASAIAMASFRSLLRAPEVKMVLLGPLIFVVVFGSTFVRNHANPDELLRPLMVSVVSGLILMFVSQLAGNQFGLDRNGFRVFVLSPAPRKDIFLGKNLALLPFVLGLAVIAGVAIEYAYPMRIDHLLASLIQVIGMYLCFSLLANFMSTYAAVPIPAGSLRPARPTGMAVLIHLGFLATLPMVVAITLIPLGVEVLASLMWHTTVPLYLPLVLVELAVIVPFYKGALKLQGNLLQEREQQILAIVASRVD